MENAAPDFFYAGRFRGDRNVAAHKHPGIELIFYVEGEGTQQIEDKEFPAAPGAVLVVPPETDHIQINHGMVETLYVVFFADELLFSGEARRIDIGSDELIKRWMQDLTRFQAAEEQPQGCGILTAILARLNHIERQHDSAGVAHPSLSSALRLMRKHFNEELTVESIAVRCGVSTSYLNTLFNRGLGIGPLKYLQRIRMAHARQLLRNPYLTVAEIGNMCGYDQPYYFCRIFKKNHRSTPGDFRRRIIDGSENIVWEED